MYSCVSLLFCSIGLNVCFCANTIVFLLVYFYKISWNMEWQYLQNCSFCLRFMYLPRVFSCCLQILGSFSISMKNDVVIFIKITLKICLLVVTKMLLISVSWFYILPLYWNDCFWKNLVVFLRSLMYKFVSSANRDDFTSFPMCIPLIL